MKSCVAKSPAALGRAGAVPVVPRTARPSVVTHATATAWDSWTTYMKDRKPVPQNGASSWSKELASTIATTAETYKPKLGAACDVSSTFKWTHVESPPKQLPDDLHDRLETIGQVQLRQALGLNENAPLDCATVSMTTTDMDAGVCITGFVQQQGIDKTAHLAIVSTETERQASWSRLEGLILHWACSEAPGGAWNLPPQGWKSIPNKVADAGGAWQCSFEKQLVAVDSKSAQNEAVYVLVLSLPLRGVLKSGGLTFVLKATQGQNTRWLQDSATKKDFFLDLAKLPIVKS